MSSSGLGLGLSEIFPESELESELAGLTTEQIKARTKNEESNAKFNQRQITSLEQEIREAKLEVKDNMDKIKANIVLPYLVANVVEVRAPVCWAAWIGVSFLSRTSCSEGMEWNCIARGATLPPPSLLTHPLFLSPSHVHPIPHTSLLHTTHGRCWR